MTQINHQTNFLIDRFSKFYQLLLCNPYLTFKDCKKSCLFTLAHRGGEFCVILHTELCLEKSMAKKVINFNTILNDDLSQLPGIGKGKAATVT